MKKALQLFLLIAVLMTAFTTSADAQYGRKKKKKKKKTEKTDSYFDDKGTFKDRLWYGADLGLRFYQSAIGIGGNQFFGNGFFFSVAPMVGYKITDNLSVGPRLEVLYQGERYDLRSLNLSENTKFNSTSLGAGVFTLSLIHI